MEGRRSGLVLSRRRLIAGAAAVTAMPALAQSPSAASGSRLLILGTKGGPTPSQGRAPAAYAVEAGGQLILVDAPDGVARQLVRAGFALDRLATILISHLHSDHVAGLGALLQVAWGAGLKTGVTVYGPRPVKQVVANLLAAAQPDIDYRMAEEGRPSLNDLVRAIEVEQGSRIALGPIGVRCALADHYTVPNIAYRINAPDRSFVFSGDTRPSAALVALARGADVLVHEAMLMSAIDQLQDGNAPRLRDHLLKSHTTTEQLGEIARDTGVKLLVVSHLVPAFAAITDEAWEAGIRKSYSGRIVVARDLMEL